MSSTSRGLAPREGLECLLVKMGRTGPLAEPRRGPQAGKSGDPHSQNADNDMYCIVAIEDNKMGFLSSCMNLSLYIMSSCLKRYSVLLNLIL